MSDKKIESEYDILKREMNAKLTTAKHALEEARDLGRMLVKHEDEIVGTDAEPDVLDAWDEWNTIAELAAEFAIPSVARLPGRGWSHSGCSF